MKNFHSGDRVRLLHSFGEGTVLGRDAHGLVRVMLDDGFEVPAIDRDLALVHHDEKQAFKSKAESHSKGIPERQSQQVIAPGLFFGITQPIAGKLDRELYLINNSTQNIAGAVGYSKDGVYQTQHVFMLENKRHMRLAILAGAHIAERPVFQIWVLEAIIGQKSKPTALHTAWHLPADFATREFVKAPLVEKAMLLHQLDATPKLIEADPTVLLDKWLSKTSQKGKNTVTPTFKEIDLHIEKLSPAAASLSSAEILQIQLNTFTEHLDRAIASAQEEIVFIHGVGNGTLRQAIHRQLAARKTEIQFFEDFQKERLGFGATRVQIA